MRYIGGGHKKKYRIIDFKRNRFGEGAKVVSIEYDPNRTAFIALVQYNDGEKRYIIAPAGLKVDQVIVSGQENVAPEIGNAMPLSQIPLGTVISSWRLPCRISSPMMMRLKAFMDRILYRCRLKMLMAL